MKKEILEQAWQEAMNCKGYENTITDTEYSVTPDLKNKIVYLAFQGSGSLLDWKQNLNILIKPYSNMKSLFFVHRGIFKKFKSVIDNINTIINPLLEIGYKLEIRGFSQGAGLVVFAHEYFRFHYPNAKIHSVAFAPPRVFSLIGYKLLKKRFIGLDLVINKNDLVPKLPYIWLGYKHYGKKELLGKRKLLIFPWNIAKEHLGYKTLF